MVSPSYVFKKTEPTNTRQDRKIQKESQIPQPSIQKKTLKKKLKKKKYKSVKNESTDIL